MSARSGAVVDAIVTALPSVLGLIASFHTQQHPDGAPLTEAEARAQLEAIVQASLARDEQLRHASAADLGIHTGSTGE